MTSARSALRETRALAAAVFRHAPRETTAHLLVTVALSGAEAASLLLLVPLLQLVGVSADQQLLGTIAFASQRFFAFAGLPQTLGVVLALYVGGVVVQAVLRRWQRLFRDHVRQKLGAAVRHDLYRALAGSRWTFLAGQRSSDGLHALTSEVERMTDGAYYLLDIAAAAATTLAYAALALRVSATMTGVVVFLGILLAIISRGAMARSRRAAASLSEVSTRFYAAISEQLAAMKLARAYGVRQRHTEIFDALTGEVRDE